MGKLSQNAMKDKSEKEGDQFSQEEGCFPESVETGLPESLKNKARELRRHQTKAEALLWQLLRNNQLNGKKFRRQHPLKKGFILDFYCPKARIGIEIDGPIHNEAENQDYDNGRSEEIDNYGISIIRFSNEEVINKPEEVLQTIDNATNPQ